MLPLMSGPGGGGGSFQPLSQPKAAHTTAEGQAP